VLRLPDAFFVFTFSRSGHKHKSIRYLDLRRIQRSQPPTCSKIEIDQIGNKSDRLRVGREDMVPAGCMCVLIILISPGRTTFRCVNWTESGKPVSVTLPTQVPSRSHPPAVTPAVPSSFHPAPNLRRRIPNGDVQSKPSPSRAHTMTTTREAAIQIYTFLELPTLSRSAHVEP
jgi:hypothetical protein